MPVLAYPPFHSPDRARHGLQRLAFGRSTQSALCTTSFGMPPPREDPIPPLKQQLAREIVALTDGWTQWEAACLLELDQPRLSNLRSGKLACFSVDRLVRLLWRLDRRVDVSLVDTGRRRQRLQRR